MGGLIARLAAKMEGRRFDQIVGIPRGGLIVAAGCWKDCGGDSSDVQE